ncbi:MAG: hypothetical protein GXO85_15945 [Chlorobi bacterium]|nr:hypothetical protein [Chlorobiota bacterium]
MKQFISSLAILAFLFFLFTCSEDNLITSSKDSIVLSYQQVPGCNGNISKLTKSSFDDSCFTYTFNDKLIIDFCVYGNCCPDSQRFVADYTIKSDTIFVEVSDTADNDCYCLCNYTVHIELSGLQKDEYLFYCNFPQDSSNYGNLKYREFVYRN